MSTPEQEPALATLARFYEAESVYLASGGGDFSGIATTLDPECVLFQPASLSYGGEWLRIRLRPASASGARKY